MTLLNRLFGFFQKKETPAPRAARHPDARYAPGDLIGGMYEVKGILGVGGFSVVYLVRSRDSDTLFALKTLRDEFLKDQNTRAQFRKEAKVWVDLERHPNIVRANFIADLEDRLYIGMEYIAPNARGLNTLEGFLANEPPSLTQSLRWSIQFCRGMEYARSRGIRCHRDVKPANIMITPEGTVKITDFGFADVITLSSGFASPRARRHVERSGFGTPTYMPPEQFRNALRCDERSDIYSYGIVLYQMATRGRLPFAGEMTKKHFGRDLAAMWTEMHRLHSGAAVPPLGSPMFPIIRRCLQKEQNSRYQTFGDLRVDLEALLKKQSGEVETTGKGGDLEAWELFNKAFSLSSLGNHDEAIRCYDRALSLEPGNADAWNNKGTCFRKLRRMEDAISCYDRAIELRPEDPAAWRNRGYTWYALGKFDKTTADLDRAIRLDPSHASAWLNKGLAEERMGRLKDAAASFKRFLELGPRQSDAQTEYARKRIKEIQRS